ncbi:energy transducer TonB [Allosphingosinicella sp.]|uniref:energy transducer TonB n=1 Tax=Allosphingosinicella sp. TaxID=2823234 RepID=UPI003783C430
MRQTLPMIRLVLAAVFMAAPLAAGAQAPSPAPARAAPVFRPWQVDWGQYYCSMIRKPEAGRPFATAFITSPGGTGTSLALVPEAGQQAPGDVDTVVLMPAGPSVTVTHRNDPRERITLRRIYGLPQDFRAALTRSTEMQLRNGTEVRARIPLDGVGAALGALSQCSSAVAQEWGLDVAALAALSRRPSTTNTYGITPDDYPARALREATQGHVIMRIAVSPEGRATACVIVATSGSPEIDGVACRIALARGQFLPALNAAGQPVAVQDAFTIFFRLPDY